MRHGVQILREFESVPKILGERGKILQILHNLLRNAKYALDDSKASEKTITLCIEAGATEMVRIIVKDNGIGIEPANITRIFAQGFTTRKGGHGFGLHSAANAAQAMQGSLTALSEGLGTGASFVLELPVSHSSDARESIDYAAAASA
jgi:signal transduction histidine kinase